MADDKYVKALEKAFEGQKRTIRSYMRTVSALWEKLQSAQFKAEVATFRKDRLAKNIKKMLKPGKN